jgi:cbb3-type cytochrome oxidase subunit 3
MYQWLYANSPYRAYPLFALIVFLTFFVGVFVWAYWPWRKQSLDERARLVLLEDADGTD